MAGKVIKVEVDGKSLLAHQLAIFSLVSALWKVLFFTLVDVILDGSIDFVKKNPDLLISDNHKQVTSMYIWFLQEKLFTLLLSRPLYLDSYLGQ